MNREQIRKAAKTGKMDEKALRKIIHEVQKSTREYDVHAYSVALASILVDKFDFDKEKIHKALFEINERFECISEDYATIKDYEDVLRDESDVVIK